MDGEEESQRNKRMNERGETGREETMIREEKKRQRKQWEEKQE